MVDGGTNSGNSATRWGMTAGTIEIQDTSGQTTYAKHDRITALSAMEKLHNNFFNV